jgi:hypothetical protein
MMMMLQKRPTATAATMMPLKKHVATTTKTVASTPSRQSNLQHRNRHQKHTLIFLKTTQFMHGFALFFVARMQAHANPTENFMLAILQMGIKIFQHTKAKKKEKIENK